MTICGRFFRRRILRFSLASVLLAITCSSIWLSMWVNRAKRQQVAVRTLRQAGCLLTYNQLNPSVSVEKSVRSWLANLVGIDFFYSVIDVSDYTELSNLTDADLALFRNLPTVETLTISGGHIGETGLTHIAQLRNLTSLRLHGVSISTSALPHLNSLSNLTELDLAGTDVSDDGLALLKSLRRLEYLDLSDTPVTDVGLETLSRYPDLKSLSLFRTRITNDGLRPLLALKRLESLFLNYTDISDNALRHLSGHPSIKHIALTETLVTGGGLRYLSSLPQLAELNCRSCDLRPNSLDTIAELQGLARVCVSGRELTKDHITTLQQKRPKLTVIHVGSVRPPTVSQ